MAVGQNGGSFALRLLRRCGALSQRWTVWWQGVIWQYHKGQRCWGGGEWSCSCELACGRPWQSWHV